MALGAQPERGVECGPGLSDHLVPRPARPASGPGAAGRMSSARRCSQHTAGVGPGGAGWPAGGGGGRATGSCGCVGAACAPSARYATAAGAGISAPAAGTRNHPQVWRQTRLQAPARCSPIARSNRHSAPSCSPHTARPTSQRRPAKRPRGMNAPRARAIPCRVSSVRLSPLQAASFLRLLGRTSAASPLDA